MSLKKEQGDKTKELLIEFAQKKFASDGFSKTRFDEIAKSQGLTTGALYHHFKNKKDLFEAVFMKVTREVGKEVSLAAEKHSQHQTAIYHGCMKFIEVAASEDYKKIMLEDAISVLGWTKWKELDTANSEKGLEEGLLIAQSEGAISEQLDINLLTRFISGGINEIALWVANNNVKKTKYSSKLQKLLSVIISTKGVVHD